ncbi:putative membrane protein [Weissella oryzae SG25]|uniref:Putative membrane protein n=1 Tax=Weissella oryzae (strain DSM 25784 / JCM 18191 / LMG 30913 / SG25) TaxID=1329250 RepID=A0A069CYK6_WEIOS|nr:membrane protein [Weissella oryzae]GAK30171.1 putative membrane protein [Weissella oryzae SG25]
MYEKDGQKKPLTSLQTILLFTIGLLFDAVGNSFTVATNMGSTPWTASAANLSYISNISIPIILFAYGLIAAIANVIILKQFDWRRFLGNMIFVILFSLIIGIVDDFFIRLGLMLAPLWIRIIIDLIAVTLVAISISITQRLQFVLHPIDDLVVITRFKYFHGDAKLSQAINFSLPMLISLGVWMSTGRLAAISIGTLFLFLFQGYIIQLSDHLVFPHLVHNFERF